VGEWKALVMVFVGPVIVILILAFVVGIVLVTLPRFEVTTGEETPSESEKQIVEDFIPLNCSKGVINIVDVVCKGEELHVTIANTGDILLYDFNVVAKIGDAFRDYSSKVRLLPDESIIVKYTCGDACPTGTEVKPIRASISNCPSVWTTWEVGTVCE